MDDRRKCTCDQNVGFRSADECYGAFDFLKSAAKENGCDLEIGHYDRLHWLNDQLYCAFIALRDGDDSVTDHCKKISHSLYTIWSDIDDMLNENMDILKENLEILKGNCSE